MAGCTFSRSRCAASFGRSFRRNASYAYSARRQPTMDGRYRSRRRVRGPRAVATNSQKQRSSSSAASLEAEGSFGDRLALSHASRSSPAT